MEDRIFGMEKKKFVVILAVVGGIMFTWASSEISNMPSPITMVLRDVLVMQKWIAFYRVLQVVGAVAAVYGGVQVYKYYKS